jgi:O-antigen/teichoic acid export membrane protein/glycosyltransferase involved in cell wall biosynthesis
VTAPDRAPLTPAEVRERVTGGAAVLVARGALIMCFGVAANIVLARLLVPRDFGVVALGTVLLTIATFLSDGGLGAGLIRRPEPPTRAELEAVNAAQVAFTVALAAACLAVGAVVGRDGLVVAAMVASLPITVLKVPSIIVLERALQYRPIATVDLLEAVSFYAVTLVAVALGLGVWGFAVGTAVRMVSGTLAMARLGPVGLVRPRWSWPDLRPLLRFGAKFQALVVTSLARDQGLNVGIAVVAGVSTLGVWNLAWRVLQVPLMVFHTVGRIGYPAMSRLLGAGQDPKPVLERGIAAVTAVMATVVVAVSGFAPALPVLLGRGWNDVPEVLLWAGIGMTVGFPITVMGNGYLFAIDAGGAAVRAAITSAIAWLAVALSLAPAIGAPAAGIGWCAGAAFQLAILTRATRARSGAAVASSVIPPTLASAAAAAAGWLVARAAGGSVPAGLLGLAAGELLLLAALAVAARTALADTRVLATDALRGIATRVGGHDGTLAPEPAGAADPTPTPTPRPTERMRISVALTTRNGERFLGALLDSLEKQTLLPDEVVVHDDASQDATVEMLHDFAERAPFEVRIEHAPERRGHVEGFMRAASACRGDIVAFCDNDDVWLDRKLEVCHELLARTGAQLAVHTVRVVDAELDEIVPSWPQIDSPSVIPPLGLSGVGVDAPGMAMVFRRDLLDVLDPADRPPSRYVAGKRMLHDEWVLFAAGVMGPVALIPEPLLLYRQHAGNISGWYERRREIKFEPATSDYLAAAAYFDACADYLDRTTVDDPHSAARVAAGAAHYRRMSANWRLRLALYDAPHRRTRARILRRLVAGGAYGPRAAGAFGRAALGKDALGGLAFGVGRGASRPEASAAVDA